METVKIAGSSVTVCTSQGLYHISNKNNIKHVETRQFSGYGTEPASSAVDVDMNDGDIIRMHCTEHEGVEVAAELIAMLEKENAEFSAKMGVLEEVKAQ